MDWTHDEVVLHVDYDEGGSEGRVGDALCDAGGVIEAFCVHREYLISVFLCNVVRL